MGLLALITPPFRLDRHSIVALVGDAMRDNRCRSIDQLFLVETPLAAPEPYRRWANSFMSLHSRPEEIGRAHVCTPVTNAHIVCRLLLVNKNIEGTRVVIEPDQHAQPRTAHTHRHAM